MAKIINTKTKEVIYSKEGCTLYTTVTSFTGKHIYVDDSEFSSGTIKTIARLARGARTPFHDTAAFKDISERIKYVTNTTKETVVIQLIELNQFFIMSCDYKNDTKGWNKILQTIFPEYSVIAE